MVRRTLGGKLTTSRIDRIIRCGVKVLKKGMIEDRKIDNMVELRTAVEGIFLLTRAFYDVKKLIEMREGFIKRPDHQSLVSQSLFKRLDVALRVSKGVEREMKPEVLLAIKVAKFLRYADEMPKTKEDRRTQHLKEMQEAVGLDGNISLNDVMRVNTVVAVILNDYLQAQILKTFDKDAEANMRDNSFWTTDDLMISC